MTTHGIPCDKNAGLSCDPELKLQIAGNVASFRIGVAAARVERVRSTRRMVVTA